MLARAGGVQLSAAVQRLRAASYEGGVYATTSGESVRVYSSPLLGDTEATNRRWAEFLTTLVHGPELATVTLLVSSYEEVWSTCGPSALACYSPDDGTIVAPSDPADDGTSAESIMAHEYGHHVANQRANPPWRAVDFGTKRWATYINVCARTRAGTLSPGNEARDYHLNPGEGFAEVYRALNETRLGLPVAPWGVVDTTFFPDATALALVEQDVLDPWRGNTQLTLRGSISARGNATRSFTVATPLDGTLRLSLRAPQGAAFRLSVVAGGRAVATGARVTTTVCGRRSYTVRVTRTRGAGAFTVAVSRP